MANLNALDLPEKSYYRCVEDIIAEQPEHIPFSMAPEKFALDVLQRVEMGSAGKYWAGGGTVMMRVALWMLPQALLVSGRVVDLRFEGANVWVVGCYFDDAEVVCEEVEGAS